MEEELVVGKDLSWMDSFPAVHEPETEYVTRNRKKKRPHKKQSRQRQRPKGPPARSYSTPTTNYPVVEPYGCLRQGELTINSTSALIGLDKNYG